MLIDNVIQECEARKSHRCLLPHKGESEEPKAGSLRIRVTSSKAEQSGNFQVK